MQDTIRLNSKLNLDKKLLYRHIIYIFIVILSIILGLKNFLIFHTHVEFFGAIIAFMMAVIAANTYEVNKANKLVYLGMAFGCVGFLDILHLLTYKGMSFLSDNTSNIPTQLWIAARYMQSISFLISTTPIARRAKPQKVITSYLVVTLFILLSIFYFKNFPICYIEGQGLTDFKIISEFIICLITGLTLYFIIKDTVSYKNNINRSLLMGLVAFLFSELFFVNYLLVDDIYNILGHVLKLISFYFIYLALVKTSLKEPYNYLIKINNLFTDKNRDLENAMYKLKTDYEALEELKEEEHRKGQILNAILETSLNGILVIGHDEKVVHCNKTYREMMNINFPIDTNTSRGELVYHLKEQLINSGEFLANMDQIKGLSSSGFSQELHFKDGRIIESSSLPFNDKGIKNGILTIFSDITKKSRIRELEKAIEIKEAIIEKAKEYDELKDNFLSTVAHEFRTPLTVILGIIQLIDNIEDVEDVEDCPKHKNITVYNSILKQNCYRLIRLTNNLIDINKIDTGFFDVKLRDQDIVSIIENITLSVAEFVKGRGLTLVFDTDVEEKILACDSYLLERVMLNLLSNSVKFTETGGKIEVGIKDMDRSVLISVKDNGDGIPKDKVDIIFDRFRQVDISLNRKNEGSGIGLALVKLIVEQHKGNIWLNADLEVGTEFIIELPINYVNNNICNLYIPKKTNVERIQIEFSDIYDI